MLEILLKKFIFILFLYMHFKILNYTFYKNNLINKLKNNSNSIIKLKIYNNNNEGLNSISNIKKVVYSALLGEYDTIKTFNLQKGFDFYLFTDISIQKINNTNWTILPVPKVIMNLNISRVKKQRFLKLHPHLFFKDYDLSIYIDASFKILGNLNEFLLRTLTLKHNIYIFEHPQRNSILDETYAVVSFKKEKESMANIIRERYKRESFPDNNGLIEGCFIIRKHNEYESINLMNSWYNEIKNYSHRDQLSFNYILWKTKAKIKYISKNFALHYFNQTIEHLQNKIYEDKK